jgi:drug/metabolite transporter (DMT)-like permease
VGAIAMVMAGLAWGIYSLIGKGSKDALADTAFNFVRCCAFVALLIGLSYPLLSFTTAGVIYAILSGALASGLGYAIWYLVLPRFESMTAAVAQLSVPVIAAFGGWLFIYEAISLRLVLSCFLVLGGVVLVLFCKPVMKKGA